MTETVVVTILAVLIAFLINAQKTEELVLKERAAKMQYDVDVATGVIKP